MLDSGCLECVLGIDGGGTKTNAVIIAPDGSLLGLGTAGSSNYDDVGADAARESISQAVEQARAQAGQAVRPFAAAFLGMAGVVTETDRAVIREIARALKLAPVEVTGVDHDCRIALAGGLSGRPGIAQIIGTGSSCYGRTADGRDWRSGGWGHLIADEGSSYWLGLQAMRAAVMAFDGRIPATLLYDLVLKRLSLSDINDILRRIYHIGLTRAEIAALAPIVTEAAQAGDRTALALLDQAGRDLAECIQAVARKLDFAPDVEIALVGGLLRAGPLVLDPIRRAIHERLPDSRVRMAELLPVFGAAVLALQSLGIPVQDDVTERLAAAQA